MNISQSEHYLPSISCNGESNRLIHNGVPLNQDGNAETPSDLPLSTKRVWVSSAVFTFFYVAASTIQIAVNPQYFLHLFSRIHYNATNSFTNSQIFVDLEAEYTSYAQRRSSMTILYCDIALNLPSVFTSLFVGSVSDVLGRKLLLLLSVSGSILKTVIFCIAIKLQLGVTLFYVGSVIEGLLGSVNTVTLALFAIVADITNVQNRAVLFAATELIIIFSGALSQIIFGYVIQATGFLVPTLVAACFCLISLLVIIFIMPETVRNKQEFTCNIKIHVKKTLSFYMFTGTWKCRLQFILSLLAVLLVVLITQGRQSGEILFLKSRPLSWNSSDIGIFNSVKMIMLPVSAMVLLRLYRNRVSLEVAVMISGISSMAGLILESFAHSKLMMYLTLLLSFSDVVMVPVCRVILSQNVSPTEQGALLSSVMCVEAVAKITSSLLYQLILSATFDIFKGAVFLVMAGLCILLAVIFGIIRFMRMTTATTCEQLLKDHVSTERDFEKIVPEETLLP